MKPAKQSQCRTAGCLSPQQDSYRAQRSTTNNALDLLAWLRAETARAPVTTSGCDRRAFTLIELLVVIAVMAILAGLIMAGLSGVKRTQIKIKARAELEEIRSAIDTFHSKRGVYPEDNTNNPLINPLFYELSGTTFSGSAGSGTYTLLDGSTNIPEALAKTTFNIGGFANCTRGGGDEGITAQKFIKGLKPGQYGDYNNVRLLVTSIGWPDAATTPIAGTSLNPWRYVSTNPTNNPDKYDLWIDVLVGGKTNRICNWSERPLVL